MVHVCRQQVRRCSQGEEGELTHWAIVRDSVHAERELLAWVLQQFPPLREGLGNHLALLDAFGLIITLPGQPGGGGGGVHEGEATS